MAFIQRTWPALAGLTLALLLTVLGLVYAWQTAPDRVSCELEWVELSVATVVDGNVVGVVSCTNHTRVSVQYVELDGELRIDDRQVDYAIRDLSKGDVFKPGIPRRAKVVLRLDLMDGASFAAKLLRGRTLQGEMKGYARGKIFGLGIDVPIDESAEVAWVGSEDE